MKTKKHEKGQNHKPRVEPFLQVIESEREKEREFYWSNATNAKFANNDSILNMYNKLKQLVDFSLLQIEARHATIDPRFALQI